MRRSLYGVFLCALLQLPAPAEDAAADTAQFPAALWAGPYAGLSFGGGWDAARWKDPSGYLTDYSEYTRFPAHGVKGGLTGGILFGYDVALDAHWLAGVSADADALSLTNLTNCASTDTTIGFICRTKPAATASLNFRIGRAEGNWLFYLKGGLAYVNETVSVSAFNPYGYGATNAYSSATRNRPGADYGAGLATRLGDGLSVHLEFVRYRFGAKAFSSRDRGMDVVYGATGAHTLSFVKTGLTYRFNDIAAPPEVTVPAMPAPGKSFSLTDITDAVAAFTDRVSVEAGLRSGWAAGGYRFDLYSISDHAYMNSRLTWPGAGMTAEGFVRLSHPSGVFIKGHLGGIFLRNGDVMHDMDFLEAYGEENSDTVLIRRDSRSFYVTADVGYDFYFGPWWLGPLIGYHYFEENQNAFGCVQLKANTAICPQTDGVNYVGNAQLVLSRKAAWHALRLGAEGGVQLTDRIRLSGEALWLPLIRIDGAGDNHWMRPDINPMNVTGATSGHGFQSEMQISYRLSDHLHLGVGVRYSHMRAHANYQFLTFEESSPVHEFTDRAMLFAQISWAFGQNARQAALFP